MAGCVGAAAAALVGVGLPPVRASANAGGIEVMPLPTLPPPIVYLPPPVEWPPAATAVAEAPAHGEPVPAHGEPAPHGEKEGGGGAHGEAEAGHLDGGETAAGEHGEHHGAAGGEHVSGHHVYVPSEGGAAVGYMLLGAVGFVMAMYYAVNWFQRRPRMYAWKMISATISIFISLGTWHALEKTIDHFMGNVGQEVVFSVAFLALYAILQVILSSLRHKPLLLVAAGTLAGHMCGFAAISVFGAIQERLDHLTDMVIAVAVFVALTLLLFVVGGNCRQRSHGDSEDEEEMSEQQLHHEHAEYLEVCTEAEDDALTLALGLLMSQLVQFLILGDLQSLHGDPTGKTLKDCNLLLSSAVVLLVMLVLSTWAMKMVYQAQQRAKQALVKKMQKELNLLKLPGQMRGLHMEVLNPETVMPFRRWLRLLQGTLAMTMAWIVVIWGQWYYYLNYHPDKMIMKTTLAVMTSVVVFPLFVLFSMRCIKFSGEEAKALKVIVGALGLMVGIAWEKAFGLAMGEVLLSEDRIKTVEGFVIAVVGSTVVLDILVLPAWAFFILPKAMPGLEGGAAMFWGKMMESEQEDASLSERSSGSEGEKA